MHSQTGRSASACTAVVHWQTDLGDDVVEWSPKYFVTPAKSSTRECFILAAGKSFNAKAGIPWNDTSTQRQSAKCMYSVVLTAERS